MDTLFPTDGNIYVVAEIANAAQGIAENNLVLIDEAAKAKTDAVKLQFYKYDELTCRSYSKYDIYKQTFYTHQQRTGFIDHAKSKNLSVWVDIFDRWGFQVAKDNIDKISAIKIPPTVILDTELVNMILELGKPVILGVGGYEDSDVDFILSQVQDFDNQILLMYGFQGFPTPLEDTSLSRIPYLKEKYNLPIGFADHIDADDPLAMKMPEYAYFAGASVIEKHITLDRQAKGLDYYSALTPDEFAEMVINLKQCRTIFGTTAITSAQKDYLQHATRITVSHSIEDGDLIFRKDLKYRRTDNADAMFPNQTKDFFPAVARRDIATDDALCSEDIRKAHIGVVVVCRLNSKRLPNKAVLELGGIPAIERCLINTLASRHSEMTILATSTHPDDDPLSRYTLDGKVKFFKGSEDDVAARFLDAAQHYGLDIIVRVTGDSPVISYELIDFLLESHIAAGADYSYIEDAPLGTKPEVMNAQALVKMKSLIDTSQYSEYLSLFFKNNPGVFTINKTFVPEEYKCQPYRLNLDYPEDYEVQKSIYNTLNPGDKHLPFSSVIDYLDNHPETVKINSSIKPKYKDGEFAEFINKVTTIQGNSDE